MKNLTETLDELVKKKLQIEKWKLDHPESVEIVQMVEDYLKLFDELYRQLQPAPVSIPPYINPGIVNPAPVAPLFPPGPPWVITNGTATTPLPNNPLGTAVQNGWEAIKA
jgi:hypothetical protein